MITIEVPKTWQDLQRETARILEECGFTVEIEKKIQTVRGEVEIDVYAEEEVKGRKYTILVECKHWKSRVPQSVIHGFRTVVSDIGANVGYIVSLTGFQSGSFSASEMTIEEADEDTPEEGVFTKDEGALSFDFIRKSRRREFIAF